MSTTLSGPALVVARRLVKRLQDDGARAIVLVGSYARRRAHYASDIDLHAVGRKGDHLLENHGGLLVSVSRGTEADARASFVEPFAVGKDVPGWRHAVILHDPHGIARRLRRIARRWTWDAIAGKANREVAGAVTHQAERVHKLLGLMSLNQRSAAAAQRSVLAINAPGILAVHHRILYETENRYVELVMEEMGSPWSRYQRQALGDGRQSFAASCRAALRLYQLMAAEVHPLLDDVQRRVVDRACELISERFLAG